MNDENKQVSVVNMVLHNLFILNIIIFNIKYNLMNLKL